MSLSAIKSLKIKPVRFATNTANGFYDTVKEKVDHYFKSRNLKPQANAAMVIKTIVMVLTYTVPFAFMFTGLVTNPWIFIGLWVIMGIGMSGIGLSVMHDANHGSYSKKQWINEGLGSFLNLIGGWATNWKIQHNMLHHAYTNVDGLDEDITSSSLLRFSPHRPRKKMHRFQHFYAWFFYGLMTIYWVTAKDFRQLVRYHKNGMLKRKQTTIRKEISRLLVYRVFYLGYILVLPILFSGMHWALIVGGFLLMHFIAGLLLACIFQPAHVVEEAEFPLPQDGLNMENNWAMHQMLNTMNFAPQNKIFSWYVGGLNFQIEHHLFPNVCHVHYREISKIVKSVARDFGLPYYEQPTFAKALVTHTRMLKKLGTTD